MNKTQSELEELATVKLRGEPVYRLNVSLIHRQGIDEAAVVELVRLHEEKLELFSKMKVATDPATLKQGAKTLENIEFAMQRNWNFPEDTGFHEWYRIPQCCCPKADNADLRRPGNTRRIIDLTCPVHGE